MAHRYLGVWVPYLRAKLRPRGQLYMDNGASLDSEEGLLHGSPLSSAAFALSIHPTVLGVSALLEARGGGARFGHDDGYLFEPPEAVMEATR